MWHTDTLTHANRPHKTTLTKVIRDFLYQHRISNGAECFWLKLTFSLRRLEMSPLAIYSPHDYCANFKALISHRICIGYWSLRLPCKLYPICGNSEEIDMGIFDQKHFYFVPIYSNNFAERKNTIRVCFILYQNSQLWSIQNLLGILKD